jgi:hypothetical protein
MLASRLLGLALCAAAAAQEGEIVVPTQDPAPSPTLRAALEPASAIEVEKLLFGPSRYGVLLAPNDIQQVSVAGSQLELVRFADELEVRGAGLKKPHRLKKAGDVELAGPEGTATLRCTPFRGALPGVMTSENPIVVQWHVMRLEARLAHIDGLPSLALLDANLNGSWLDFGTDLVLRGEERIATKLSKTMPLGERWYGVKKADGASASGEAALELGALESKIGALDPRDASRLPASCTHLVLVNGSQDEALFTVGQEPLRLPPGPYRLRHAICGDAYEAIGGEGLEPWCTVTLEETARPSFGAPYRLRPFGMGFKDLDAPVGSGSSFSSAGGRIVFHIHGACVRGGANETWDRVRAGALARVLGATSFGEKIVRLGTTMQSGKPGKSESWCFAKRGTYESPATVTDRTASFWMELEVEGFGELRVDVPLGGR